jgi:hypothetical protein
MDPDNTKQIPAGTRLWHIVLSMVLLVYGFFGVYLDDLYIPGKHTRGVHLHGEPAWIMFGAFVCAALNLLSVVADYYDPRDDERVYRAFARAMQIAGWTLFAAALVLDLVVYHKGTR